MADYYDQAGPQLDQDTQALLAAIAQHGSQAGAEYAKARDAIAQRRVAAIQAALGEARQYGGAPNQVSDVEQRIGSPFDRRLADLDSANAGSQSSFGQLSSAGATYMDSAKAGLPALRTELAGKVAGLQAQVEQARIAAQQQAEDRALNRELTMLRLQNEREAGQRAAASSSKPMGVDDVLRESFGGLPGFQEIVGNAVSKVGEDGGRKLLNPSLNNHQVYNVPLSTADVIGQAAGLPRGMGSGLYAPAQRQRTVEDQKQARQDALDSGNPTVIRSSPQYGQAVTDFLNGAQQISKGDLSEADILNELVKAYGPDIARQVMADYGSALNG